MSTDSRPPVIIAGGGPTGLMLAAELGLASVATTVVERLPKADDWSRALTLQARSAQVLRLRGLDWFAGYPPVRSYNFGLLELTDLIEADRIPLLVPQRHLERHLEERALELGVQILRGTEVRSLDQDDDGVTVGLRGANGEEQLRGSYLVGCDGGSSAVRKLLGIDFPGTASTIDGITGDVRTAEDVEARLPPTLYDDGLFAITPLRPGLFRVTMIEFGVPMTSRDIPVTVEEFRTRVRRVSGVELDVLDDGEAQWLSRFGNPTRQAERYRDGRVLLAGDSAHIHLPVSGQGLNTGLQDAFNLGWKLAAAWHGWAPAGLLDTYHAERHPVGRRVCMNTAAQDALMYPLRTVTPLRELFAQLLQLPAANRYLTDMVTGLGIRYPMPGDASQAHPLLGARLPDVLLAGTAAGGPASTGQLLQAGRGILLDLFGGGRHQDAVPTEFRWADRVDVLSAAPVKELDAATLLIRPDGYVAYADRSGTDVAGLVQALNTWFGPAGAGTGRRGADRER